MSEKIDKGGQLRGSTNEKIDIEGRQKRSTKEVD